MANIGSISCMSNKISKATSREFYQ